MVERRLPIRVSDGEASRPVYDWAKFEDRETVWIRTRRGLELEGSVTHRVLLPDGSWRRLDELQLGDRVVIGGGAQLVGGKPGTARLAARLDRITLQDAADAGRRRY